MNLSINMNTEQFLEECNKSPLLKNYRPVYNSLVNLDTKFTKRRGNSTMEK
jgi:hypothetical protein